MAPAMFVPWRGDWTSEKTGIHPPFKCSHTRSLFTPTTKQLVPKYAISLARFGNLALKVLGWETSLRDCLYKNRRTYTYIHNLSPYTCIFIETYEECIITWNKHVLFIIEYRFLRLRKKICIKITKFVAQIFINKCIKYYMYKNYIGICTYIIHTL